MPLYRKSSGGTGGGIPAVTLVHPDGTSEVFNPDADTDVARGNALLLALAAFVAGDLIVLGVGDFVIAITAVNTLRIRGQGQSTRVRGSLIAAFNLTAGTSYFADMIVQGGMPMGGGNLDARNMRIEGTNGDAAIIRTGAVGRATLRFVDLKAGVGSTESIKSGGSSFIVDTVSCTANVVPDVDVSLTTPAGLSIDANYP